MASPSFSEPMPARKRKLRVRLHRVPRAMCAMLLLVLFLVLGITPNTIVRATATCSLATCVYVPSFIVPQLPPIVDGSFESIPLRGWTLQGDARIQYDWLAAHTGPRYAEMGNLGSSQSSVSQLIAVPADQPYLSYWYKAFSSETDCTHDTGAVWVNPTPTDVQAAIRVQDINEFCYGRAHSIFAHAVIDLRAYAGNVVLLQFIMTTSAQPGSYWSFDDVAFQGGL